MSMSVNQMMAERQETRPVKPDNKVVKITPNADGSMTCEQASGNVFTIPAEETTMQEFVTFTMLFGHEL